MLLVACGPQKHTPDIPEPEPAVPVDTVTHDSIPVLPPTPPVVETPNDTKRNLTYLFDLEAVPEIKITVSQNDWNTYLSNFDRWNNNRLYVPAQWDFIKDGVTYHRDSVGLRPRGNTSRRRAEGYGGQKHRDGGPWYHSHFGICFTTYESGERFFGCDRLVLKYAKEDPTYVHEIFSYDMLHRFGVWSAPYASYCRLSIYVEGDSKPAYLGVYAMIENPRKGWLNDRCKSGYIPDSNGNMWKAAWGANLSDANADMGVSDDYGNYTPIYDLKTNKKELEQAKQELRNFITELVKQKSGADQTKLWLEEHLDVDLFLRTMAVDAMIGQWDNYWGNQNNYLFYFDSQHRFYFIPFDYDNTLGTGQTVFGNPGTQDLLNWGSRGGDRPLVRKVLSIPEYENRYKRYIRELAESEELLKPSNAMARVRQMQSRIRPYVPNDTGEDNEIADRPASWSHYPNYKLLSGNVGDGLSVPSNYFKTKVQSIRF